MKCKVTEGREVQGEREVARVATKTVEEREVQGEWEACEARVAFVVAMAGVVLEMEVKGGGAR
jgi:hypothetical protein